MSRYIMLFMYEITSIIKYVNDKKYAHVYMWYANPNIYLNRAILI